MSDNVRPTLDDLTECWCGYQAAGVSDLTSHQLYCDPHNTAPKVIDDQRKRITELEAQLAAAQAEMQAMVSRLTKLAKELQTEETWDGKRNDALRYCAGRLRETIMRSQGSKKPRKAGRMR